MTKTITGQPVRINLADTKQIAVGAIMRIGFDYYTVTNVDEFSIMVVKAPTILPADLEWWIMEG